MTEKREEEQSEEGRMPVGQHLEELRKRLLISICAVLVAFGISLSMTGPVLTWLKGPLGEEVYFFSPTEAFWTHLKVAFFMGLGLSLPLILYHFWRFVSPALYRGERRYAVIFMALSMLLFALGFLFCGYVALPFALKFLVGFGVDRGIQPLISVGRYVDFTLKFYLAFGLVFQVPLAVTLLSRMGLMTPRTLSKNRKYAFLINAVLAATLTPTSDIFNMMLMLLPLTILYEIGILGARLFGSRRDPMATEVGGHAGAT